MPTDPGDERTFHLGVNRPAPTGRWTVSGRWAVAARSCGASRSTNGVSASGGRFLGDRTGQLTRLYQRYCREGLC